MAKIVKTIGREILDSRGNPTVEVECFRLKMVAYWPSSGAFRRIDRRARSDGAS